MVQSLKKRGGEIGEAMFVQRALAQGLRVAKVFGESDPFDYLVGDGTRFWRTQVKSTMRVSPRNVFHAGIAKEGGTRPKRRPVAYLPSEIDFFGIVLLPEDSVYVVPIEIVEGRLSLSFHAKNHPAFGRWRPYLEAWDLLRQRGEKTMLPPDEPNARSPRRLKWTGRRRKE